MTVTTQQLTALASMFSATRTTPGLVDAGAEVAATVVGPTSIPLVLQDVAATGYVNAPVQFAIQWQVLDQNGVVLPANQAPFAPEGLNAPSLTVVFEPTFARMRDSDTSEHRTYILRATLTLTAADANGATVSRALNDLRVTLRPIELPAIAAYFRHYNFRPRSGTSEGSVLIHMPGSTPIRNAEDLLATLRDLRKMLERIAASGGSSGQLAAVIGGLRSLTNMIAAQENVTIVVKTEIESFEDLPYAYRELEDTGVGPSDPQNAVSSIILFGRPGTTLSCHTRINFQGSRVVLHTGKPCHALVRSLALVTQSGRTTIETLPTGLEVKELQLISVDPVLEDRLTSAQFVDV